MPWNKKEKDLKHKDFELQSRKKYACVFDGRVGHLSTNQQFLRLTPSGGIDCCIFSDVNQNFVAYFNN